MWVSIGQNAAVLHQDDAVHRTMEHILQAVLNDNRGFVLAAVDLVDDLNSRLPRGRVQVGQGLVKEEDLRVVDQHAGQSSPLLLSAGDLAGFAAQDAIHTDNLADLRHPALHLILGHAVVLHGEGDVLRHRQPHKLGVGVLQDRAHFDAAVEDVHLGRVLAVQLQLPLDFPFEGEGDQSVDAVGQRALPAAAGADDQDLFMLADFEIDVIQGGLRLGVVLKGKMLESDCDLLVHIPFLPR